MMKKHSSASTMLNRIITRCAWRKSSDGLTRKTTIHGWFVRNHMQKSTGDASMRCHQMGEPRAVLSELGLDIDESVELRVWDSSAEIRYMVVPQRPEGTDDMSEDELAELVMQRNVARYAEGAGGAPAE